MTVESGARPSNTLSGDLRSRPLAVLLAGAGERRTSGTFTFHHGKRRDLLTMHGGKIAVVRTSDRSFYLGGILFESGAIGMGTLDTSLHDVADHKRLHGDVLIERGDITREQLDRALAEQTFRKVHHLFSLPDEASWSFREDVDELTGARDEDRPPIETWQAIWRSLRDRKPNAHVERTIAKVDGSVHLREIEVVARFGLSPEELAICQRLNTAPQSIDHVFETSGLGVDCAKHLIYVLALARCLVRVEAPPVGPLELGEAGVRERAKRIDQEAPHVVLGLRAEPTAEAVRAAFFRLSRLWQPGKLTPELDGVRAECIHVYARLTQANRALLDAAAGKRAEITFFGPPETPLGIAANDSIAPPPATTEARSTMSDADSALLRGDLAAAALIARSLTSTGSDGPSARALIAWCKLGTDSNTDAVAVDEAIAALDRILTGDPDCVRALSYRARMQRRRGREEAAIRDFRKLARLDSRNSEAHREVRLYDARIRASSGSEPPAPRIDWTSALPHPKMRLV